MKNIRWRRLAYSPLVIVAAAVALRLAVTAAAYTATGDWQTFHAPDTARYLTTAESLVADGRFAIDERPEILRTPGYPLMLVPGVLGGHVEAWTLLLQITISGVSVWLVYQLALALTRSVQGAALAGWLYAAEPLSVVYSAKLLSETLFAALVVGFVLCMTRYLNRPRVGPLLFAAVVLALATYVRPIVYFLPPACALLILGWGWFGGHRAWRTVQHAVLFFAVCAGLIGAWQVRNARVAGYPNFSAISDMDVFFQHSAAVLAAHGGSSLSQTRARLGYQVLETYLDRHPEQRTWSDAQRYVFMRRSGIRTLLDSPVTYAQIHGQGMVRTLLGPGATPWLTLLGLARPQDVALAEAAEQGKFIAPVARVFRRSPLALVANVGLAVVLLVYLSLAVIAIWQRGVWRQGTLWILLLVAVYLLVVSGGPIGEHRFRHPIMPLVSVLSGVGLWRLIGSLGGNCDSPPLSDSAGSQSDSNAQA